MQKLIGRATDLEVLCQLAHGDAGLVGVALVGAPGVGKSCLLDCFASSMERIGRRVVRAVGHPGTQDTPAGSLFMEISGPPPVAEPEGALWWLTNRLTRSDGDLVVVLDDAHWADDLTIAACNQLADSGRVVVAAAMRDTEAISTSLARFVEHPGVVVHEVANLGPEECHQFVSEVSGVAVSPQASAEVHRLTGGNPLLIVELLRDAEPASLQRDDWTWGTAGALPPNLSSLLSSRIRGLSDPGQLAVWGLSAAQRPVGVQLVVDSFGPKAAEELVSSGLAATDSEPGEASLARESFWWRHPLIGEVVDGIPDKAARFVASTELLYALGRHERQPTDQDALLLGHLELLVERPTVEGQRGAARAALRCGDPAAAIRHASASAELLPDHESFLLLARAEVLAAGRIESVTLEQLTTRARSERELVDGAVLIAQHLARDRADHDAAMTLLDEVRARSQSSDARDRIDLQRLSSVVLVKPPVEQVVELSEVLQREDLGPRNSYVAKVQLAVMSAAAGAVDEASALAESAMDEVPDDLFDTPFPALGLFALAMVHLVSGDAGQADRAVHQPVFATEPKPGTLAALGLQSQRGSMSLFRGHVGYAWSRYIDLADQLGNVHFGVLCRIAAVWEGSLAGRPTSRWWQELQRSPLKDRQGSALLEACAGISRTAAESGAEAAALKALEAADVFSVAPPMAAWMAHEAARFGAAYEGLERLESLESRCGAGLVALLCRSAASIAEGEPILLAEVAADLRRRGFDLFAAEAEVRCARLLTERHQPADAARSAVRAHLDMEAAGGPRTPVTAQIPESPLTTRQVELAHLAAQGLSNGEIAERLVVSKRTVENHLYRVYTTLELDRPELGSVFDRAVPEMV